MNIRRTAVSLLLFATLGTSAQAQLHEGSEPVKAGIVEAGRTVDVSTGQGSALELNDELTKRHPGRPRSTTKQAPRPALRIETIDPLLPFGQ